MAFLEKCKNWIQDSTNSVVSAFYKKPIPAVTKPQKTTINPPVKPQEEAVPPAPPFNSGDPAGQGAGYMPPQSQNMWNQQPQPQMNQQQNFAQNGWAQPPQNTEPLPNMQQPYAAAPEHAQIPQNAAVPSVYVINARSVINCYDAINFLRTGNTVILVLENISDAVEMRHYVDMMSGACYAVSGSITKLSRYGTYLLAPGAVKVTVDAITNQLNSAASRTGTGRNPQQPQQQAQQQANSYQPDPSFRYQQAPSYQAGGYYNRSSSPEINTTATIERGPHNGYVPDDPRDFVRS